MPMNMSYCRFENTLHALQECAEALDEGGNYPLDKLSGEEQRAAKGLLRLCKKLADYYEDISTT